MKSERKSLRDGNNEARSPCEADSSGAPAGSFRRRRVAKKNAGKRRWLPLFIRGRMFWFFLAIGMVLIAFAVAIAVQSAGWRTAILPVPFLILLPLLVGGFFALAAIGHYGTAVMHSAEDLPDIWTAMIGGAIAGALATVVAILSYLLLGLSPISLQIGVLFAGLIGEYTGGRTDDVWSACLRGGLGGTIGFASGTGLMTLLQLGMGHGP